MLQHGAQRKVTKLRDGPVPVIEGGGGAGCPSLRGHVVSLLGLTVFLESFSF